MVLKKVLNFKSKLQTEREDQFQTIINRFEDKIRVQQNKTCHFNLHIFACTRGVFPSVDVLAAKAMYGTVITENRN